jgi:hypothetical protein
MFKHYRTCAMTAVALLVAAPVLVEQSNADLKLPIGRTATSDTLWVRVAPAHAVYPHGVSVAANWPAGTHAMAEYCRAKLPAASVGSLCQR